MSGTTTPAPGWRSDVRDRVAAALAAGVPQVAGRVHRARVWPIGNGETERPALLVYGYAEEKVRISADMVRQEYAVTCQMVVEVRTAGRTGGRLDAKPQEDALEGILRACEGAVLTNPDIVGPSGCIEKIEKVTTVQEIAQRGDDVEAEAKIAFEMNWLEVFHVAPPPEEPCADATFAIAYPGME